jgi:DNA polymerase III alpha subunit (gram-positive type)
MITFKQFYTERFDPYNTNPFAGLSGKTLILFDTETGGFSPRLNQITEIAAIAVDGESLAIKDEYHKVIHLHQEVDPAILKMTHYDPNKASAEEQEALNGFLDFVASFPNPILVAHNAQFDMKMVMTRVQDKRKVWDRVYDTADFSRLLFAPMLVSMTEKGNEQARIMLDIITKKDKSGSPVIIKNNRMIDSRLGALAAALQVEFKDWHSALADTKMLLQVFTKMKEFYDESLIQEPSFRKAYTHAQKMIQYRKEKDKQKK